MIDPVEAPAEARRVVAAALGRLPLFQGLRPSHLDVLAAATDVRRAPRGSALSTAGVPAPGLVVLRSGRALRTGIELEPGDWFGEMTAFDPRMAGETTTALEDVEYLVLPPRALHDAVRADPELGVALLREMSRQFVRPGDDDGEQLLRYAADLRETFREGERRQAALRRSIMGTVRALVALAESKDPATAGHATRAARTARALARALGDDDDQAGHAALGGLLHDVGMLAVDGDQVQAHPELGARIIEHVDFLKPVVPYVLHHHERHDGRGYPRGLVGKEIPREGRLMAAVEVYETLRAEILRAGADPRVRLVPELRNAAGRQLDREMVVALVRVAEADG